jgi:TetR/AcrR family transcriptional regulator, transcriptional repressor of bet genes
MNSIPRPKGREAVKAWNRQKIIDATIDVVTRHGIAGTTVARVVKLAGVSMGLVNVHFKSKDALLSEVLLQMADEYNLHWRDTLENAPEQPVAQLKAMVLADLDPAVLNPKTLGVWFAFRAQARARPEYLDLVGTRERRQMQKSIALFQQMNQECSSDHPPSTLARGLSAMLEGMWTEYYLYPNEFDRAKALECIFRFLDAMYPGKFSCREDEN